MSNSRHHHTLEVPIGDVLMLMEALRLAATTAMLSQARSAQTRLREYQAYLDERIPAAARLFSGYTFCDMNLALADASDFEVLFVPERLNSWRSPRSGRIAVRIGSKEWVSSENNFHDDGKEIAALIDLLEELAPLDCRRIVQEAAQDK